MRKRGVSLLLILALLFIYASSTAETSEHGGYGEAINDRIDYFFSCFDTSEEDYAVKTNVTQKDDGVINMWIEIDGVVSSIVEISQSGSVLSGTVCGMGEGDDYLQMLDIVLVGTIGFIFDGIDAAFSKNYPIEVMNRLHGKSALYGEFGNSFEENQYGYAVKAVYTFGIYVITFIRGNADANREQDASNLPHDSGSEVLRGVSWGMTKEEIIAIEGQQPMAGSNGENIGFSNVRGGGLSATLFYYFNANGECYKAVYAFNEKHSNDNDYIADFSKLKSALIEKYGTPATDDIVWKNSLFKNDPERYGLAVSAGHLVYKAVFETEGTSITLGLIGDNYEISHILYYESKALIAPPPEKDNSI